MVIVALSCGLMAQTPWETLARAVTLDERGEAAAAAILLTEEGGADDDLITVILRGDLLLKASRVSEAGAQYARAESMKAGAGLYGLARCAAIRGDTRSAISLLEAHLLSPLRRSEPEIMLDQAFSKVSSSPEWRALWKREWYKVYERKGWEIDHHLAAGRTDLAEEVLGELRSLYGGESLTDYYRARLMNAGGRYREAATLLATITSGSDTPAAWLYALAEAREGEGSYYAAATVYQRLISDRQPDPQLLLRRSRMLLRSGDRQAARGEMERFIAIDPDNTEALGLIGRTYAEEGAIYEALPYLNANIEKHPGEASAFRLRGDAWLAARTWERAADDYAMSLDLDPGSGEVNLNLGIALIRSGRSEQACHYLRRARSLGMKEATEYLAKYCIR